MNAQCTSSTAGQPSSLIPQPQPSASARLKSLQHPAAAGRSATPAPLALSTLPLSACTPSCGLQLSATGSVLGGEPDSTTVGALSCEARALHYMAGSGGAAAEASGSGLCQAAGQRQWRQGSGRLNAGAVPL